MVLFIVAFTWEVMRSAYFAIAGWWYGWSKEEKHERLIARERRIWARDERSVKKDQAAAVNVTRERHGVTFTTLAVAMVAYRLNLPWWETALTATFFYPGLTMAAGLSFKW